MDHTALRLRVSEDLRFLLSPRHRDVPLFLAWDAQASLGHVLRSTGIPLTEVGPLRVDGQPAVPTDRACPGAVIDVSAVRRPQAPPFVPLRFLLDVHLGALARRLRLVGLDSAYENDRDDPSLVRQANAEHRVLLTQDRGLLHRTTLTAGAFVRGTTPDAQLADVLTRFAPPLAPWTRCIRCNGALSPVAKADIQHHLERGTRATYDAFARCTTCGKIYWPGAHHGRLARIVAESERVVADARTRARG